MTRSCLRELSPVRVPYEITFPPAASVGYLVTKFDKHLPIRWPMMNLCLMGGTKVILPCSSLGFPRHFWQSCHYRRASQPISTMARFLVLRGTPFLQRLMHGFQPIHAYIIDSHLNHFSLSRLGTAGSSRTKFIHFPHCFFFFFSIMV